mgnify:FL=1
MIRKLLAGTAVGLALSTSAAAQVQWSGNGHYYEYVQRAATWADAFSDANSRTYLGLQGYLATVTSNDENEFVSGTVAGNQQAWLGGSDAGNPVNNWTWRNGPEAGQAFSFTAWSGGEPNNCCGGEDYVVTNWGFHTWNDIGAPAFPNHSVGYVVEYSNLSAVPEPETYAMMLAGLGLLGFAARRRKQNAAT